MPSSHVMPKFQAGTLRSGSGQKVRSRKQAIAIMMSERDEEQKEGRYKDSPREERREKNATKRRPSIGNALGMAMNRPMPKRPMKPPMKKSPMRKY